MDGKTILLVEDEVVIALAQRRALEKLGYAVSCADSGEAAVEAFSRGPRPDLVLMDIDLGKGMDGTQAAERILGMTEVPVVFLSSHAEPEIVEKTEKVTSYGYIVKSSGATVVDASIKMAFRLFEARKRLRDSEESLSITLQSIGDAVMATDTGGLITRMNRTAEALTGWSLREAVGRPLSEVFVILNAATRSPVEDPVRRVLRSGEIVGLGNHTALIDRNGREYQINDSAAPIRDARGLVRGVILVFSDVTARYEAETRLRENERMLLESQAMADIGSFTLDLRPDAREDEAWRASPQTYAILGIAPDHPRTRGSWERLVYAGSKDAFEALRRRPPEEGARHRREYGIARAVDGAERWVQEWSQLETDEAGLPSRLVGTIQDITERKRIEEELRLGEKRLSVVFNANHDMQLLLAVEPDGTFRTVAVNQHYLDAARALGLDYTREKLLGKTVEESLRELGIGGELYETTMGRYRRAAAEGIPVRFEEELELPGGAYCAEVSIIPVPDARGACAFLLYSSHDITERKLIEKKLRATEALYHNLADMSQDLIFQCDAEGRYSYLNPAWEQVLGYAPEEMIGRSFADFQPEGEARRSLEEFARLMRRNSVKGFETVHLAKDGRAVHLVFSARAVLDGHGATTGTCGTAYDISERKRAEEEIKALLAEKDTILREVHHRVKNNMQAMKGFLALQAETAGDGEAAKALMEASERMVSMELLYEKLYTSTDVSELSMGDYLPELVGEIVANHPSKVRVAVETEVRDFVLDAKRLHPVGIIVNELLTNALKYAFAAEGDNRIVARARLDSGRVIMSVEDNGVGLPESVDFGAPGGFGMTLVESLARQLRGTVRVERGRGTGIVLEFPY